MNYSKRIQRIQADYQHQSRLVKEESGKLVTAQQSLEDAEQARKIVQTVAESVQEKAHRQIAGVVSRCLQTVFGEEAYEFRIEFVQKRGRTEARLCFVRDGKELDPLSAAGGGTVDVAAFALRIACLMLSRPKRRRLLVADEPFRFVSAGYRETINEMLTSLSKELNLQIILVTHSRRLMVGKVIELPLEE